MPQGYPGDAISGIVYFENDIPARVFLRRLSLFQYFVKLILVFDSGVPNFVEGFPLIFIVFLRNASLGERWDKFVMQGIEFEDGHTWSVQELRWIITRSTSRTVQTNVRGHCMEAAAVAV